MEAPFDYVEQRIQRFWLFLPFLPQLNVGLSDLLQIAD